MANIDNLVQRLRRKAADWVSPLSDDPNADPMRETEYYRDALLDGLNRFNDDATTSYTLSTLPVTFERVVLLAAQIEIVKTVFLALRSAPASSEGEPNQGFGEVQRHMVPGHEVWFHTPQRFTGADLVKFLKALEDEYQTYLRDHGHKGDAATDLPDMVSFKVHRESLRRNRAHTNHQVSLPLTAPESFMVALDGSRFVFTWEPVLSTQFSFYQIEYIADGDAFEDDAVRVACVYNNQATRYVKEGLDLDPGTYHFRLGVRSKVCLWSYSEVVEVVIE